MDITGICRLGILIFLLFYYSKKNVEYLQLDKTPENHILRIT